MRSGDQAVGHRPRPPGGVSWLGNGWMPCPSRDPPTMDASTFISKWKNVQLTERSAAQQHFLDLCELVGHPKPAEMDPKGEFFTFERGATKRTGGKGWADVWKRGYFAFEYKGKRKDLDAAYDQLLLYR